MAVQFLRNPPAIVSLAKEISKALSFEMKESQEIWLIIFKDSIKIDVCNLLLSFIIYILLYSSLFAYKYKLCA